MASRSARRVRNTPINRKQEPFQLNPPCGWKKSPAAMDGFNFIHAGDAIRRRAFVFCHRKGLETAGFQGFFFAFSRTSHSLFCPIGECKNGADFASGGIRLQRFVCYIIKISSERESFYGLLRILARIGF